MSIYIPRCDTRSLPKRGIHETDDAYESRVGEFIKYKFNEQYYYGDVHRVDIVAKFTPKKFTYYVAFLHINWNDTNASRMLQAQILDQYQHAKLYYNGNWFWHLNKNHNPLSATEAALHKRIYNLERDLTKVNRERNAAHVLLLQKAAPNNWNELYNYVVNSKPHDYHAALCSHVHNFIPNEFRAPLMIEPLFSEPVRVEHARVEHARDMIYTPATRSGFDDEKLSDNDYPKLVREKPQRTKPKARSVTFNIQEEYELPKFELPSEYEDNCDLLETQLDNLQLNNDNKKTEPLCVGSQSNNPEQDEHFGENGCLGKNDVWHTEFDYYSQDKTQ